MSALQKRKPVVPCAVAGCEREGMNRVVRTWQIGKSATGIGFYYCCDECFKERGEEK